MRISRYRIHTPTPAEIVVRKRLRGICEWFHNLNGRIGDQPDRGLTESVVAEIKAQNFEAADLMAIRGTPFKWSQRDPYQWLWILHRYQNSNI